MFLRGVFLLFLLPGVVAAKSLQLGDLNGGWKLARDGEGGDCSARIQVSTPKPDMMQITPQKKGEAPDLSIVKVNQGQSTYGMFFLGYGHRGNATFSDQIIDQTVWTIFSIFSIGYEERQVELYPDNALMITVSKRGLRDVEDYRCVYIR